VLRVCTAYHRETFATTGQRRMVRNGIDVIVVNLSRTCACVALTVPRAYDTNRGGSCQHHIRCRLRRYVREHFIVVVVVVVDVMRATANTDSGTTV
jgi:hypothetical protein